MFRMPGRSGTWGLGGASANPNAPRHDPEASAKAAADHQTQLEKIHEDNEKRANESDEEKATHLSHAADAKLDMAKKQIGQDDNRLSKKWLGEIQKDYPDTDAAKEAGKLLKSLK